MRVFDPWVGANYWSIGLYGVRVLILGESHYGEVGTETPACTTDVIKEWAQEKRLRFFTITQKLVAGLNPDQWVPNDDRAAFWEQVAFYNFVQTFVGDGPRHRPTQEMWAAASEALLVTIAELKPQVVVVLGFELQARLPELPLGIHFSNVQHPSSRGFQYSDWQPAIQAAIKAAARGSSQPSAQTDGPASGGSAV